jgi:SAM-dependent methyltransferase
MNFMYDDITTIYQQIFSLNQAFLQFIQTFIKKMPSRILDLGCGPGDYVNELARQGHQVTGIDSSTQMIAWAKQHHQGNFHHLSFTEINTLKGQFDCIYCIGNSLSYLPYDATDEFINDVFSLLLPEGRFILQLVNWDRYRLAGDLDFPVIQLTDGKTFHRTYEAHPDSTVLFKTEIQKNGQPLQTWADHLYPRYSDSFPQEFTDNGFKDTAIYGDFKQNPFGTENSPAFILITHKGS